MITPEVIDKILDEFDFERVHKAMVALNWEWYDAENGVPSIAELRKSARRLLTDCVSKGYSYLKCGGFLVENQNGILRLSFEVCDTEAGYNNETD